MAEVTTMLLRVDLDCHKCYKKIKKLLCKYPEIRNQEYFEKEDTVRIKVVCCSPERIRQKLICKGGKTIKSIEIKRELETPKPPATVAKPPATVAKPPATVAKPPATVPKPTTPVNSSPDGAVLPNKDNPKPNVPARVLNQVTGYPPMYPYGVCCKQCFGPCHCHHGYVIPYQLQPPSSYDSWPSGCRCDRSYGCRCEYYIENYPPCTIM